MQLIKIMIIELIRFICMFMNYWIVIELISHDLINLNRGKIIFISNKYEKIIYLVNYH